MWVHVDLGCQGLLLPTTTVASGCNFLAFRPAVLHVQEDALWGLMRLKEAVLALPNLKACKFDPCIETLRACYSNRFMEMMHVLLGDDWRQPVPVGWKKEFERTWPDGAWYDPWVDQD